MQKLKAVASRSNKDYSFNEKLVQLIKANAFLWRTICCGTILMGVWSRCRQFWTMWASYDTNVWSA